MFLFVNTRRLWISSCSVLIKRLNKYIKMGKHSLKEGHLLTQAWYLEKKIEIVPSFPKGHDLETKLAAGST